MNIYDIAERAGVSIATVSRVVNGSPLVSEKTKQRVRAVMEECRYTPNVFARGLGLNSMKTVGLVCPDVSDRYVARAVAFLERGLSGKGYGCILCCTGFSESKAPLAVGALLEKRVDALVLVGSHYARDDADSPEVGYLREAARQVPVFLINGYIRDGNIYCALCDDCEVSRRTVAEMLASGRRRVLFLSDSRSFSANQKLKGYEMALLEAGVPIREELKIYSANEAGCARDVLAEHAALGFDGVFATEDGLALGALKYAKSRCLRVPGDVCITGYNNSELAACCEPELSSIDSRCEALCRITIDSMMLVFGGEEAPHKTYANGYLVRRGSTGF